MRPASLPAHKTKEVPIEEVEERVPTYHNAKYRPENCSPLSRDEVMKVCDYLECTSTELNSILLIARYEPIDAYPSGDDLEAAVVIALETMKYLPLPAHVITRDWNVQGWNEYTLKLLGWDEQIAQSLRENKRLNVLHLIFDESIKLRSKLRASDGTWESMAKRNVYGFKMTNIHCRHDDWYKNLVSDLMQFDGFEDIWNSVDELSPINYAIEYITEIVNIDSNSGESARFRSSFVCNGDLYYPLVSIWVPIDQSSRRIFHDLGVPIQFSE